MTKAILDTNIIPSLFKSDKTIVHILNGIETVYIPVIVIGELYFGALTSKKAISYIMQIRQLEKSTIIINCDYETGKIYGDIKSTLKHKRQPIPDNDIWIAALSIQYDLPLLTRDKHFNYIDELTLF